MRQHLVGSGEVVGGVAQQRPRQQRTPRAEVEEERRLGGAAARPLEQRAEQVEEQVGRQGKDEPLVAARGWLVGGVDRGGGGCGGGGRWWNGVVVVRLLVATAAVGEAAARLVAACEDVRDAQPTLERTLGVALAEAVRGGVGGEGVAPQGEGERRHGVEEDEADAQQHRHLRGGGSERDRGLERRKIAARLRARAARCAVRAPASRWPRRAAARGRDASQRRVERWGWRWGRGHRARTGRGGWRRLAPDGMQLKGTGDEARLRWEQKAGGGGGEVAEVAARSLTG